MKSIFSTFLLIISTLVLYGQQTPTTTAPQSIRSAYPSPQYPDYFKVIPPLDAETPEWAKKMYAYAPNVFEVDFLYDLYYQTHEFSKTIHTQNYKHWRRQIRDLVNDQGLIEPPTRQEEELHFRLLRQKKQAPAQQRAANWVSLGPVETYLNGTTTPTSHQVNVYALDQSASNPDVLYAGTEGGGVFKTTDRGLNWNLVSKNEVFSGGMSAVKIHPTNDNVVFVTGNSRIYKSTDGGSTWAESLFMNATGYEVKFHPSQPDTVFCAASNGLYRSYNGGANWTTVFNDRCWDIDFHPTNPDTVYLLKSNDALVRSEFFLSANEGVNWTLKDNGWYSPADAANASNSGGKIAVTAAAPSMIYVALIGASKANDNGWIGVYRSTDRAETWVNPVGQDGGPYNSVNVTPWNVAAYTSGYHQGFYNFDLEVSDINPAKIWIGTVRLSESSDSAKTFTAIGAANSQRLSDMHADIQDIEVNGNDVWVANDGGINYSNDELMSHSSRKKNIIGSDFWGFGSGWNEDVLVGGKYHNGNSAYYQTYGTGLYHHVGGVEEATGYVNPIDSRKSYFNQYWSGGLIAKSIPDALGGSTVEYGVVSSLIPNESYVESSSSGLYFDPRYANHVYQGNGSHIYKSVDGGASYTSLHDFGSTGKVFEIAIARSNPEVIYCVFQPGGGYWDWVEIHRTTDGGQTWAMLTTVPASSRWRMEITVNPSNADELWVAANAAGDGSKVFSTSDGGASWVNRTTSALNGERTKDICFQAGTDLVYLATNENVYYWDSGSSSWMDFGNGLPMIVSSLEMRPFYRDNKLRLATYGRGIWESTMQVPSAPIAQPITYADSVYCRRDTVQFDCYSVLNHNGASWQWAFNPAPLYVSSTSVRNPRVLFAEGSYDVTLTVTDGNGQSDTKTVSHMVTMLSRCEADTVAGRALLCSNSGDYAQLPTMDLSTNTLTISAWVKPEGLQPDYSGIVMNDGTAAGFNFAQGNNTLAYHWPGGAWWWNSGLVVPADEWSHVAMVATPTSMTLYLNGIPATHTTTLNSVDLSTMKIGSYQGWGSRNFKGHLDEVCIWDRALNQDEIRALRHLTKKHILPTDPNLIAYYQFNAPSGAALDRVGNRHATLSGGSSRAPSTAPVGGGTSQRMTITSGGVYNFTNTGLTLGFPASGTYPNGELVVSRLHVLPNSTPNNKEIVDDHYWIINNYGSNSTFSPLDSITFNSLGTIGALDAPVSTQFLLYKRASNADGTNWTTVDKAEEARGSGQLHFGADNGLNSFSQLALSDFRGVELNAKVFLQGPYDNGFMKDDLRSANVLPLQEPYTALGFTHLNGGGSETCPTSVLSNSSNDAIVDWVFLELRSSSDSSQVRYTRSALLQKDGDIVDIDGSSALLFDQALPGDYFLSIHHRNHLGLMTANRYTLSANPTTIDLRSNIAAIFKGSLGAATLGGGHFGLLSGDVNGNQQVQNTDVNSILQEIGLSGYLRSDLDMNNQVQNAELQLQLIPNVGKGSQVPN
ncbi:MAG: LamG-like jellyroll fold domain-containing protein [Bacteroidota bacterium]